MNEFKNVFNGISLNIDRESIKGIEIISGVEAVYPNLEVQPMLMDSIPLTNVDDVWKMDKDGNSCIDSGKECLTGENLTIAIIDTGIDYTHPDLGNCTSEEFLSGNCKKVVGGYDFVNNMDMNNDGDLDDCFTEENIEVYCEFFQKKILKFIVNFILELIKITMVNFWIVTLRMIMEIFVKKT